MARNSEIEQLERYFSTQLLSLTNSVESQIRTTAEAAASALEAAAAADRHRNDALRAYVDQTFEAHGKALVLAAAEYERRFTELKNEHARIDHMQLSYVRADVYQAELSRIYSERQEQLRGAAAARIAQEATAANNRRAALIATVTSALSLLALTVSVLLHFAPIVLK